MKPPAVFLNSPYTAKAGGPGKWLAKAREAASKGCTVVCLVPARPDTQWWVTHVLAADEVRFVVGRLTFGDATSPAPFPSAIVVYRPHRYWAGPNGTAYTVRPLARPVFSVFERTKAPTSPNQKEKAK